MVHALAYRHLSKNNSLKVNGDFASICQHIRRRPLLSNQQTSSHFFVFSVLFLDSLDQLSDQDDGRALRWLPTSLPKNVHIVVSTLPTTGGCLAVLKTKLKPEINAHMYLEACHIYASFFAKPQCIR